MPAAQALLEQNTHSETLMAALPALHRLAMKDDYKDIFYVSLRHWLTLRKDRIREQIPNERLVLNLLEFALRGAVSKEERDALEVIMADWKNFAPADFLLGFM
jgi:hypothetical protein